MKINNIRINSLRIAPEVGTFGNPIVIGKRDKYRAVFFIILSSQTIVSGLYTENSCVVGVSAIAGVAPFAGIPAAAFLSVILLLPLLLMSTVCSNVLDPCCFFCPSCCLRPWPCCWRCCSCWCHCCYWLPRGSWLPYCCRFSYFSSIIAVADFPIIIGVWTTGACATPGCVYTTPQGPVQHVDVSQQQVPLLLLDVSTMQRR